MEIKEITDKEQWESFASSCRDKTFLQSWNWGEFQKLMRGKIWRFGFFSAKGGELLGIAQVVRVSAKRGTFLLVPHGPITLDTLQIANNKSQILQILLERLREIAKEEQASFIRINPVWERNEENNALFKGFGFLEAPLQMHPEASWKLDIAPSEEELFKGMRKTTRYLIRKAQENADISISQSKDIDDVKPFSKFHEIVSKRQHFTPFSLEYLENEFNSFAKDGQASIFWGRYKGEVAAASFVVFWAGQGFYHHAVSLPQYAKLSVPYLIQWEAIKEAKKRGCSVYDFWGYVDPVKQKDHPWSGPTLFKMGFGGKAHLYVTAKDLPLSLKYWPTMIFEKIRRMRRHL
ncbi:MAG: peptidoglycan bridge formation glycyltransferase FemA/FemB family protein [Candidatus Wildermuthbacteria bacterium]|nr:peptidoglycan bridge formation glycyltransferase FemA/FemB family protein [Candidatus Wildermuthbacteria bacterium]